GLEAHNRVESSALNVRLLCVAGSRSIICFWNIMLQQLIGAPCENCFFAPELKVYYNRPRAEMSQKPNKKCRFLSAAER
ncbi:MAG: hypothetical protein FWG14_11370, partial [Peptococcaceae bacterium]|nr:hypothetical protein [Peptococcaceae bacterium]